jgi:AbiV family abortive infection protein
MKNDYENLLSAILNNARNLKSAAVVLFKTSLQNRSLRPYAQFMLYACVEECGKFLLALDQFPRPLSDKLLQVSGFYDHESKIKRLVTNIREYEPDTHRNDTKIARTIRENLREISIYVDFKSNKIIPPQFVKNKQSLDSLVSLVIDCIKFCEFKLKEFKKVK